MNMRRRELIKGGFAIGAAGTMMYPAKSWGSGVKPVKIGMVDAKTGTYAAQGRAEIRGATMAMDEVNAKGGILGRPVQLIAEDDHTLPGPAVSKAHLLLERDKVDFLMGGVSSAVAVALSNLAHKRRVLYIDTGGHVDSITQSDCHWTTFRTCSSTSMLAGSNFDMIFRTRGKRWYFITPDYSYGYALHREYSRRLKRAGGTNLGNELTPLGTTDFSTYLIRARAANADVLMVLVEGDDLVNCLKEIVQFDLNKKMAVAGALMEMEMEEALPRDSRIGLWSYEWYWKQPNVPEVAKFVQRYANRYGGGKVPTARVWFGFASMHALAMAANDAGTLHSVDVSKALAGLTLPPEVSLQPGKVYYRQADHQLIGNEFVGHIPKNASYPNMFSVDKIVRDDEIAVEATAKQCKMVYPS